MYNLLNEADISLPNHQLACQIRIPFQWAIGLLFLLFSSFQLNSLAQANAPYLLDLQEVSISCQNYSRFSLPPDKIQLRIQAEDAGLIFHQMEISMLPHPNASPDLQSIVLAPHLKLQRVSWNRGSLTLSIAATETITLGEFGFTMDWQVRDWEMDHEVILNKDGIVEVELIQGLKVQDVEVDPVPNVSMQAFPNPASEWISLQLQDQMSIDIEIRNPQGRLVAAHKNLDGSHPISVQGLAPGVYLLTFLRNGKPFGYQRLLIE